MDKRAFCSPLLATLARSSECAIVPHGSLGVCYCRAAIRQWKPTLSPTSLLSLADIWSSTRFSSETVHAAELRRGV